MYFLKHLLFLHGENMLSFAVLSHSGMTVVKKEGVVYFKITHREYFKWSKYNLFLVSFSN